MRTLLFTGKGGAGKTTVAAATATRLARWGRKTLVISTDPAHSLADTLATPLDGEPRAVAADLYAVQVDARALTDGAWRTLREALRSVLTGLGVDALDAEELTVLPGVDELLALTEVRALADAGPWDTVVVDCGPTAETSRLLALPEAVAGYLSRTAGRGPAGMLDRLAAHVDDLRRWLTDAEATTVRLVLTPERVVLAETRRLLTSLTLRGIAVDGLVVNRMMPTGGLSWGPAASWLRARRRAQDRVLAELRADGLAEAGIRTVQHRPDEPIGPAALDGIADELYAADGPAGGGGRSLPLLRAEETEDGFLLRIEMPLAGDSTVDLARVDDDLAVTVDGFRRLLALPDALRPCRVTEAESDARGLVVHLERSP